MPVPITIAKDTTRRWLVATATGTLTIADILAFLQTARATVDFSVGRSRIALGASLGTARLVDGPVRGEIDGGSVFVGYEAWWLDIGP